MLGKPHILSLFPNSFNKFNKMRTHVISSFYHIQPNKHTYSYKHTSVYFEVGNFILLSIPENFEKVGSTVGLLGHGIQLDVLFSMLQ